MPIRRFKHRARARLWLAALVALAACSRPAPASAPREAATTQPVEVSYERPETRQLVELVDDAARLIAERGDAALERFRETDSRWRHEETYVFVLDPRGNMLVHPDPSLEGENTLGVRDVNGRPIIVGLLHAAMALPDKPEGWYHYEWPVPAGLLPRWKSSYVRRVTTPSGKTLVVGAGMYDDRMERAFVVDMVDGAVGQLEKHGEAAFAMFHDPKGPFLAKDAYVFVIDSNGVDLVNPAFPNLEGRNLLDVRDTQGKPLIREMFDVVATHGAGWVDYMWPKPGDDVSTQKSTYVRRANVDGKSMLVGCGVYLADARRSETAPQSLSAPALMQLVRDAARVLEERGADAYPELRERGSRWFRDDTYVFVWDTKGIRTFHAADPTLEGQDGSDAADIVGRPYGTMFLDVAETPSGEGWVHYMYPEPGDIFPAWKSTFLKKVTFPSGQEHLVGAGIYHMKMDRAFIRDLVDRAATLVAERGEEAFDELRDETGPFYFMDTYVFVLTPDGTELVNPGQPSLEGMNLLHLEDVNGKPVARANIEAAMRDGSGWVEYEWYKPGHNTPARKETYVRKVELGRDTYIIGSGRYLDDDTSE
jgi:signal transduction histidine kinase